MSVKTTVGAMLAALLMSSNAAALETYKSYNVRSDRIFTPIYGTTLPPVGYVDYCRRNRGACEPRRGEARRDLLKLTPGRLQLMQQINAYINGQITPVSDADLYDRQEHWTVPTSAGDCEDYVLLKKQYLEDYGFPADSLLITVVLDEFGDGHAVLTVATDSGDFILDNRRSEILHWHKTDYTFLKRQSQANPNIWISLTGESRRWNAETAGRN